MENNYCKKCGECCKAIRVNFKQHILYRDGIQTLSPEFEAMLTPVFEKDDITFCRCKYLDKNLCKNPKKPEECKEFPSSSFAFLPEECGYTGYIFLKSEKIKAQIRRLKEEIIHYEAIIETCNNKFEKNQLNRIIKSHREKINKFLPFGSDEW